MIITATSTLAQHYHTVFADAFIQALSAAAADHGQERPGLAARRRSSTRRDLVEQSYEQSRRIATEHAVFDDTGDGAPHDKPVDGGAGTVAAPDVSGRRGRATSSDPGMQQLLERQRALTEQVDDLRRRRPSMTPPKRIDAEFEKLIIELSVVSRDVRRKGGEEK